MSSNLRPPLGVLVKAAVGVTKFPTELQYAITISGKSRPMTFSHSRIVEHSCYSLAAGKTAENRYIYFTLTLFLRSVFSAFATTDIAIFSFSVNLGLFLTDPVEPLRYGQHILIGDAHRPLPLRCLFMNIQILQCRASFASA